MTALCEKIDKKRTVSYMSQIDRAEALANSMH